MHGRVNTGGRMRILFLPFVDGDWHAEWKWICKLITALKHLPMLIQARHECAKGLVANLCHNSNWVLFLLPCAEALKTSLWVGIKMCKHHGGKKCCHSVQGFLQLIKVHHLSQKTGWTCWPHSAVNGPTSRPFFRTSRHTRPSSSASSLPGQNLMYY